MMRARHIGEALAIGLVLAAGISGLGGCSKDKAAAASSGTSSSTGATSAEAGPITITVNAQYPETETFLRQVYLDDVKAFEAKNPGIKLDAREGRMDPRTFETKLAGGQLEDVFYVYFTDPAGLIAKKQV